MSAAVQPTLVGETIVVRPMTAHDVEPLYAVASDPAIWAMHPESTRWWGSRFWRARIGGTVPMAN